MVMAFCRKRKTQDTEAILAMWKQFNSQADDEWLRKNEMRLVPLQWKGSKGGRMRGKGGQDNIGCKYRGVRQMSWGKWVAEIREPDCIGVEGRKNQSRRLWLVNRSATARLWSP